MHSKAIFSNELPSLLSRAIMLTGASHTVLITDTNTHQLCSPKLGSIQFDFHYELPVGEMNKNSENYLKLIRFLMKNNISKKTVLIALGGGMVTDIVGFVASTYKRGIPFINIPTTLLAMVDASIGGKTGIDFNGIKNSIGSFYPPKAVLSDAGFLDTLSKNQIKSGWAEVIKHLMIENISIPSQIPKITNSDIVLWSGIKHNIVQVDPYEKFQRLALNAGHTVGHALEGNSIKKGKIVPHGFAVAAGLWVEALICKNVLQDDWSFDILNKIIPSQFQKVNLDVSEIPSLIEFMRNDKKNRNNQIVCSLLKKNGALAVTEVTEKSIEQALNQYINL